MRAKPFTHVRPAALRCGKKVAENMQYERVDEFTTSDGITIELMEPSALNVLVGRYSIKRIRYDGCPPRDEVRATLKCLHGMSQREAAKCWDKLDQAVKIEIRRVTGQFPCPENLPEVAGHAEKSMTKEKAGRLPVKQLAEDFARDLSVYWYETKKQMPTVQVNVAEYPQTEFQIWAADLFMQAGYLRDIAKHLQNGLRAAKKSGLIPR